MRPERRHVRRHEALKRTRWLGALALGALAACGGITIQPDAALPKPLMQPLPTSVGVIVGSELRNFQHKETRWATEWKISLGVGHAHLVHDMFTDSFAHVVEFKDLASARAASGLKALFEPLIDQYSFVTDRDTGGRYFAVTIRYRINVYTPQGEKLDTLTLTGYGSSLAGTMSNGKPLEHATLAAMRDAAAKFLVQFPQQPAGQQLAHDEALAPAPVVTTAENAQIEAVPVEENPDQDAPQAPRAAPPAAAPAAPPPPTPATGEAKATG